MKNKIKRFIAFVTVFAMLFGAMALSPVTVLANDTLEANIYALRGYDLVPVMDNDVQVGDGTFSTPYQYSVEVSPDFATPILSSDIIASAGAGVELLSNSGDTLVSVNFPIDQSSVNLIIRVTQEMPSDNIVMHYTVVVTRRILDTYANLYNVAGTEIGDLGARTGTGTSADPFIYPNTVYVLNSVLALNGNDFHAANNPGGVSVSERASVEFFTDDDFEGGMPVFNLELSNQYVYFVITAENDNYQTFHRVTVRRLNNEAGILDVLNIPINAVGTGTLTDPFRAGLGTISGNITVHDITVSPYAEAYIMLVVPAFDLAIGENDVLVRVASEDETVINFYLLSVDREDANFMLMATAPVTSSDQYQFSLYRSIVSVQSANALPTNAILILQILVGTDVFISVFDIDGGFATVYFPKNADLVEVILSDGMPNAIDNSRQGNVLRSVFIEH